MKAVLVSIAMLAAAPVYAQSSLGVTGADLSFGVEQDEQGDAQGRVSALVDVAITANHGVQGDLTFYDTRAGSVGTLTGHLYLQPKPGQKYGLFASMSDVDGHAMLWGSLGAEGIFQIGKATSIEGRIAPGAADVGGLDYIFAGAALAHELTPDWQVGASFNLADFDEADFRATSYDLGLTARYGPEAQPWGAYDSIEYADLAGRDGASGETRLGLGITYTFGDSGGISPATRPFRMSDPVAPLVRRGLY